MIRTVSWFLVIIAVLFFGAAGWTVYQQNRQSEVPQTTSDTVQTELGDGRYGQYNPEALRDERYTTTLLFFTRPGSEESDAFSGVLAQSELPDGTQVLHVNGADHPELVERYNVTIPPTFVRLAADGSAAGTWQAYGQTKTVDAILQHTQ